MKSKYSYLERVWMNKVNSPFAELIMYYGESKNKLTLIWLIPLSISFFLFEFLIIYPLIWFENFVRRIQ